MKKLNLMICLAAMMVAATSCDDHDDNTPDTVSERDRTFMMNAADGGMLEVKAGELAVAKGDTMQYMIHSERMSVRTFGQKMITDHTKANEELKALADKKQVAIPTTLSQAKQQKLDSLSAASGAAFNMMYSKMMVVSHQETVSLFRSEANDGDDNEVKSWAAGKLPTLEHHLQMSEMMRYSLQ